MFGYLVLLFTIIPALELAVLIKVGTYIGVGNTLFLIVLTGVVGATLARLQGFVTWQNIQISLNEGRMPTEEMLDGLMILLGGIVLLTPGFITDIFGFFLLIPWTRYLVKIWTRKLMKNISPQAGMHADDSESPLPYRDYEDAEYY